MLVPKLGFVNLFVSTPPESAQFYGKIFGLKPIQESPTWALFVLANGVMLGLWSRATAEPKVTALPGCSEICFAYDDVDGLYQEWLNLGIPMAQEPTEMDFGRTFVALDPDGHRIRVYKLSERQ